MATTPRRKKKKKDKKRHSTHKKTPKRRNSSRKKGAKFSPKQSADSEPKYIEICKSLLSQITKLEESQQFHESITSKHKLYKQYMRLIPDPMTFMSIHGKIHEEPCGYASYEEFNGDVERIFAQEKLLQSVRGKHKSVAAKRMQSAVTTENYWNTLTASYRTYGFDAVVNYKPDPLSDDDTKEQQKVNPEDEEGEEEEREGSTTSIATKSESKSTSHSMMTTNNKQERNDTPGSTNNSNNSNNSNSNHSTSSSEFDDDTHDNLGKNGDHGIAVPVTLTPDRKKNGKKKLTLKATPSQSILHNMKKRVLTGSKSESARKRRKLNHSESVESVSSPLSSLSNSRIGNGKPSEFNTEEDEDSKMKEVSDAFSHQSTPRKMKMEQEEDEDSDLSADRYRNGNNNSNRNRNGHSRRILSPQSPDTPFTPFAEKSKVFANWMGSTEPLYQKGVHPSSGLRNGVKQRLFADANHVSNRNKPMHRYKVKYRTDGTFMRSEQYDHVEAIRMDFAVKKFHEIRPNAKIISCVQLDH